MVVEAVTVTALRSSTAPSESRPAAMSGASGATSTPRTLRARPARTHGSEVTVVSHSSNLQYVLHKLGMRQHSLLHGQLGDSSDQQAT